MNAKLSSKRLWIVAGIAVLALVGVAYWLLHRGEESTDDATLEAHVVTLSSKVSGYVKILSMEDNQLVRAGDVLLQIDPADYQIRRDRAAATLVAMKAQAAAMQAALEKAQEDAKRMRRLTSQARSQEQLDQASSVEKAAQANKEQADAQVVQAEADLAQAEDDLANTKILAPMDGRITKRGVERGDYVQPGQALGYLVGNDIWVIANFKETQITHMKPGQKADIHIDAFPNAKVEGRVDSIQSGTGVRFSAFPPENATGNFVKIVQRVPVKILLTTPPSVSLPLGPGMSVEPTVDTR